MRGSAAVGERNFKDVAFIGKKPETVWGKTPY